VYHLLSVHFACIDVRIKVLASECSVPYCVSFAVRFAPRACLSMSILSNQLCVFPVTIVVWIRLFHSW
jgi:hypothetical protein